MKKNPVFIAGFFGAGFVGGVTAAYYYQQSSIPRVLAEIKELPPGETKTFKFGENVEFTYTKKHPVGSKEHEESKIDYKEILLTVIGTKLKFLKGPVAKVSRYMLPKHIAENQVDAATTTDDVLLNRVNYHI